MRSCTLGFLGNFSRNSSGIQSLEIKGSSWVVERSQMFCRLVVFSLFTIVTPRTEGSVRAALPHTAPTLGVWR